MGTEDRESHSNPQTMGYSLRKSHDYPLITLFKPVYQFFILSRKNWLLRLRNPYLLAAELFFPILFVIILAVFRSQSNVSAQPACHLTQQSLPSMGLLRYTQSLICNFNYTCHPTDPDTSEKNERLRISTVKFLASLNDLLSSEEFRGLITTLDNPISYEAIPVLFNVRPKISAVYSNYESLLPLLSENFTNSGHLNNITRLPYGDTLRQISTFLCGSTDNDISYLLSAVENASLNLTFIKHRFATPSPSASQHTSHNPAQNRVRSWNICPRLKSLLNWKLILHRVGRLRYFLFAKIAYFPVNSETIDVIHKLDEPYRLISELRIKVKLYFNQTRSQLTDWILFGSKQLKSNLQICTSLPAGVLVEQCEYLLQWLNPTPSNPLKNHWSITLDYLDTAIAVIESFLDCILFEDRFTGFNNLTDFEMFLHPDGYTPSTTPVGLLFDQHHLSKSKVRSVHLRFDPFLIDPTFRHKVFDPYWTPIPRREPDYELNYFTSGFIDLQDNVGQALLMLKHIPSSDQFGVEMKMFPTAPYIQDSFLIRFSPHLPQFMILAWSLTVIAAVKYMVDEREHGILDVLQILGVPSSLSRFSWLLSSLTLILITAVPMILILKVSNVLPKTEPILVFTFIFVYALAILCFSMLASMFFTSSNLASVISGGIYFICYLPAPILLHYEQFIPQWLLVCACLLPQVNHTFVWAHLLRLELHGSGAQWSLVFSTLTGTDGLLSLGLLFLLLLITIATEMVFALWIVPFFQFLTLNPSILHFRLDRTDRRLDNGIDEHMALNPSHVNCSQTSQTEPSLVIHHLTKIYNRSMVALNEINLKFYPNDINVLMGHNGAGKSTLLSILTGTTRPTSGHVIVQQQLIDRKHIPQSNRHRSLGYCPQQDILYPNLNVAEHVNFFSALRGRPMNRKQLDKTLTQFGFLKQRECLTRTLSGGQQRKLSVCLAFLGAPSNAIILLDEPTASMDPLSKHLIWDSIRSLREGRTILFTSHHMREADYLADQVAMLYRGRLCSVGSCVSLKAEHGSGYRLTIEKKPSNASLDSISGSSAILTLISHFVPRAELIEDLKTKLIVRLPIKGALNGQFVRLFEKLEVVSDGEFTFSITDVSFEDVFHDIMRKTELNTSLVKNGSMKRFKMSNNIESTGEHSVVQGMLTLTRSLPNIESNSTTSTMLSKSTITSPRISLSPSVRSLFNQVYMILFIRFRQYSRNKCVCLIESVLPCLVLLCALILITLYHPQVTQPPMFIHPWLMTTDRSPEHKFVETFFHLNATALNNKRKLFSSSGIWTGLRCIPEISNLYVVKYAPCSNVSGEWEQVDDLIRRRRLMTNDILFNLTSVQDLSEYVMNKTTFSSTRLFGGLSTSIKHFDSRETIKNLLTVLVRWYHRFTSSTNKSQTISASSDWLKLILPPIDRYRVWYNNKGYVSAPAYLNILHNLFFGSNSTNPHGALLVANHPLPFPTDKWLSTFQEIIQVEGAFSLFLIIALTVIPANFAVFMVRDAQLGIRHVQCVAGLGRFVYWLVHFAWDASIYVLSVLFCTLLLIIFDQQAYIHPSVFCPFLSLILVYGVAVIPLTYLATLFFQHPSTAYVLIGATHMVFSSLTMSINVLLHLLLFYNQEPKVHSFVSNFQGILYILLPHHCLGSGVLDLAMSGFLRKYNLSWHILPHYNTLRYMNKPWILLAPRIAIMVIQGGVYLMLLLIIEYRSFNTWSKKISKPIRVQNGQSQQNNDNLPPAVEIVNLTMRYRGQSRPAVNGLCLNLNAGDCFGLLGMNGAGKSSTFELLTGRYPVPQNTVRFNGIDLSRIHNHSCSISIGYCPQRDALHDFLTARECLSLYGRLRGLSGSQLNDNVNDLIKSIGLDAYADRLIRTYSGGTKRKLSTAIAFIGDPRILLLDEPSRGMDPGARRLLWDQTRLAVARGCVIMLSSHCMDECESLCTRVGLLVDGQLKCDDSPANLKRRFGIGYTVDIELSSFAMQTNFSDLNSELNHHLPQFKLSKPLTVRQRYEFPIDTPLSTIFRNLQVLHRRGLVKHFSVKHRTLEDAFLKCIASA